MKIKVLRGTQAHDTKGKMQKLEPGKTYDIEKKDARFLIAIKKAEAVDDDEGDQRKKKRVKPDEANRAEAIKDEKALTTDKAAGLVAGKNKK